MLLKGFQHGHTLGGSDDKQKEVGGEEEGCEERAGTGPGESQQRTSVVA